MLCSPRTGSNYLLNLLIRHKRIKVLGEIFNLDSLDSGDLRWALSNPIEYFDAKFGHNGDGSISVIGAKMFYDHLTKSYFDRQVDVASMSPKMMDKIRGLDEFMANYKDQAGMFRRFGETWDHILNKKDINIIHLKRNNVLRSLVSLHRAFRTNEWLRLKNEPGNDSFNLTLDFDACLRFFEHVHEGATRTDEIFSGHEKLDISYEELEKDKDEVLNKIMEFLKLEPYSPSSTLKKQIKEPLSEIVLNYYQLKKQFSSTSWAGYFDE